MSEPCIQVAHIAHITETMTVLDERMERLDHAIHGNGDPGIRANMLLVSQQQQMHNERLDKIERLIWWALSGIVGSVGFAAINLVLKK